MPDTNAARIGVTQEAGGDPAGTPLEVLRVFAKLGMTCFGGPIAHLGYFRDELVVRRKWLSEDAYADIVALAQFLPGPASSQVGFSLGLIRAGWRGGLAAFIGFTLPSALLMVAFAYGAGALHGAIGSGLLQGLRLVAVAIVAQAVWGMARTLCPDRSRASIAVVATLIILASGTSLAQIGAIVLGGIIGAILCRGDLQAMTGELHVPLSRRVSLIVLAVFVVLLAGLPVLRHVTGWPAVALFDAFYRSGALVFGGGHVVLPLLHDAVVAPGWVSDAAFLNGYGAAQAVPGPLFTFSAYLGTIVQGPPNGPLGATISLIAIFLPGLLAMTAALPFWDALRQKPQAQAVMRGVNAAVVGLLGAALYNPVWTSAIKTSGDFGLALLCFVLLMVWRLPPLIVVIVGAAGGIVLAMIG
jgi:chromate transporter